MDDRDDMRRLLILLVILSLLAIPITIAVAIGVPVVEHAGNYTVILSYGQTPYQLGPFFTDKYDTIYCGWSWWDTDGWGDEEQQNLVLLTIYENSTGVPKPVTGLTSLPSWPQASYQKHSGNYSWKADTDPSPITTQNNYADLMNLWMWKELNLTGYGTANLTFWTNYSIETDWDYGYVMVSTDKGATWTSLPGTLTTNTNPNGNNLGNGITGSSGGWVQETMNLTPYAGQPVIIAFRFKSDAAANEEGWYVDDINVTSDAETIFTDDTETCPPVKTLTVNVTYPHLTLDGSVTDPLTDSVVFNYTTRNTTVNLIEDYAHPGNYYGFFKYDVLGEHYSGNYSIQFNETINSTPISASSSFQTTLFGCQAQGCHYTRTGPPNETVTGAYEPEIETSFVHSESYGGMESCTYNCHAGSKGFYGSPPFFGPPLTLTPIHVHEMVYGHQGGYIKGSSYTQPPFYIPSHVGNVNCTQCHTGFIHDNVSSDTAKVGNFTLYGSDVGFVQGVHVNVTCEQCHGDLSYPSIPSNQYMLNGTIGDFEPKFTSHEEFTRTYITSVDGSINISVTVESNASKYISLYVVGPVDNTSGLQGAYEKSANLGDGPVTINVSNPWNGTWIIKVIRLQKGVLNYNITSSYPMESKPIIKIPYNCSTCHPLPNSTLIDIPSWDHDGLAFSHIDTNDDMVYDVQCRACHGSMHNIGIRRCQDCHTNITSAHHVSGSYYQNMNIADCIKCHSDPHNASERNYYPDCVSCHDIGELAPAQVGISVIAQSVHVNLNSDADTSNTSSSLNAACWACHCRPAIRPSDYKNPRDCEYCHVGYVRFNASKVSEHYVSGEEIQAYKPCWSCHKIGYNTYLLEIRFNKSISASEINEKVSHYGEPLHETCISCHQNTTGEDYGITKLVYKHANNSCKVCHASARTEITSLHNENLTLVSRSCRECHTSEYRMWLYDGPERIKSHYPMAPKGQGNTLLDDYTCEYCHGLGTTQKLHSSNLTTPSWGCADCHMPNGTGPRARYVHPTTAHKSSTADCITCHGDDIGVLHEDCGWCHNPKIHDAIQKPASTDCTSCHLSHLLERSTCLQCHQYHLHAIRTRVFTPYGWFKSNDSAYAPSGIVHPAHKGDNPWARFALCAPCHGVVECDKCHIAPEVTPTPIPTPTMVPTPSPTVTPTPAPTATLTPTHTPIPGFEAVFAIIGLLAAVCALLLGRKYK